MPDWGPVPHVLQWLVVGITVLAVAIPAVIWAVRAARRRVQQLRDWFAARQLDRARRRIEEIARQAGGVMHVRQDAAMAALFTGWVLLRAGLGWTMCIMLVVLGMSIVGSPVSRHDVYVGIAMAIAGNLLALFFAALALGEIARIRDWTDTVEQMLDRIAALGQRAGLDKAEIEAVRQPVDERYRGYLQRAPD